MLMKQSFLIESLTILLFIAWLPFVSGQNVSFEISDSSLNILRSTGNINTSIAEIQGSNAGTGKVILKGLNQMLELNNLQIAHLGGNELGLDGDIVPYASVTFDLGNNVAAEHWDQVVAKSFITYQPPAAAIVKTKSKDAVISQIMQIEAVEYTMKNNQSTSGFLIPQLKKYMPEVLSSYDEDFDQESQKYTITETETGINYDAFIPILIKAIQEQQVLIEDMRLQLSHLTITSNP